MNRMIFIVVLGLATLVAASASSAPPTELEFVRNAHRASRDAIRTVHATYDVQRWQGFPAEERPGAANWVSQMEWWQDGEKIRWKETMNNSEPGREGGPPIRWTKSGDTAVLDGTGTSIQSQSYDGKERLKGASLSAFDAMAPIRDELWYRASFALTGKPHHTLTKLLDMPDRVQEVEATEVHGAPYYRTRILSPEAENVEIEAWLDPRHNFLVKKWRSKPMAGGSGFRDEQETLSFRECEPSVYFPQETLTKVYWIAEDGRETLRTVCRTWFRSVEINRPIAPETFVLTIPPGMSVVDYRNGTRYRLGQEGQPTDIRPAPAAAKDPVFESVVAKREGIDPVHIWAVVGISLVLGAGLTAFFFRKRRQLANRS